MSAIDWETYDLRSTGYRIGADGEPLTVCPYSPGSTEGRMWLHGWAQGRADRERSSGDTHRRTMAQRAEARRTAAQWEPSRYADNPVDALCAEVAAATTPPKRSQSVGVSLPWSDPNVNPWDEIKGVWEQVAAALAPVFDAAAQAVTAYADFLDGLEAKMPATVERKRHGAASVCPRHGPTRGGLCRRCAR